VHVPAEVPSARWGSNDRLAVNSPYFSDSTWKSMKKTITTALARCKR